MSDSTTAIQTVPAQTIAIEVSPAFAASVPAAPQPSTAVATLGAMAVTPQKRDELACQQLLVGETRQRAIVEADNTLAAILQNTQVLTVYGTSALDDVNHLNDRMLNERPPVNVPQLQDAMKDLSRQMRGIGKKYDPNDPSVIKKYEKVKGGILRRFHLGQTFLEEFMDDVRSLQNRFEQVIETLGDKQYLLLKNVAYYDEFYELNEEEIDKLIYVIGVMEIMRDMAAQKAASITVGNSNIGDRGQEAQARISEIVTLLENRIIAFKGRLWVAWAMSPQIRTMRAISVGLSARIDQTVDVTIPTMKSTILVWLTLGEAKQAEQFNRAVEETYNRVMTGFATAAQATVPVLATALSTPALSPATVKAWSDSLAAQADGVVAAIQTGQQQRATLEQAMVEGKAVIDAATMRVNQAQLNNVLSKAQEPLQIAKSVS